jgi:hypothetical protein
MENQDPNSIVPAGRNIPIVRQGRFTKCVLDELLYDISEHQVQLLVLAANDMGYDFNILLAGGSAAITIGLALNAGFKDPADASKWWVGFMTCTILAAISFVRWLVRKSTFNKIISEIRSQKRAEDNQE